MYKKSQTSVWATISKYSFQNIYVHCNHRTGLRGFPDGQCHLDPWHQHRQTIAGRRVHPSRDLLSSQPIGVSRHRNRYKGQLKMSHSIPRRRSHSNPVFAQASTSLRDASEETICLPSVDTHRSCLSRGGLVSTLGISQSRSHVDGQRCHVSCRQAISHFPKGKTKHPRRKNEGNNAAAVLPSTKPAPIPIMKGGISMGRSRASPSPPTIQAEGWRR